MRIVVLVALSVLVVVLIGRDAERRRVDAPPSGRVSSDVAAGAGSAMGPDDARAEASVGDSTEDADEIAGGPWGNAVTWHSWEEGIALARAENKPLCLVVYANWCERCKELAPVFQRPGMAAISKDLVMVRQDQDEAPAWLAERFGELGNYIPRVLFLDADGALQADIQSGHPRYPYFYSPHVAERLAENMIAAKGS